MKRKRAVCSAVMTALVGLNEPARAESSLEAGVAVVDMTPIPGCRMSGYFHERLNTGTLDPLLAKAVGLLKALAKAE